MSEFLLFSWRLILQIYDVTYQGGLAGCLITAAIATFLAVTGRRLAGQRESYHGTVVNGQLVNIQKYEAVRGTAKTWVGHLGGQMLTFSAMILYSISIFAFVNYLMYGGR